jgi:methionyl-tRNA formyltransferase
VPRAVVFAYHNVGVRCLKVLLAHGVEVPLVVTHEDSPQEEIWFDSVAAVAAEHGIPALTPADPNAPELVNQVAATRPDFLFSFYYRLMLKPPLLALAPRGALNMHGSLLPKYRGRVPVNWAIIRGETETGATLHSALPALLAGTAPRLKQNLSLGAYFGGRRPEDGVIDWSKSATEVHNLVRALAPPYPGARTTLLGKSVRILRSQLLDPRAPPAHASLAVDGGRIIARCGGGGTLLVRVLELEGRRMDADRLGALLGGKPVPLGS